MALHLKRLTDIKNWDRLTKSSIYLSIDIFCWLWLNNVTCCQHTPSLCLSYLHENYKQSLAEDRVLYLYLLWPCPVPSLVRLFSTSLIVPCFNICNYWTCCWLRDDIHIISVLYSVPACCLNMTKGHHGVRGQHL